MRTLHFGFKKEGLGFRIKGFVAATLHMSLASFEGLDDARLALVGLKRGKSKEPVTCAN